MDFQNEFDVEAPIDEVYSAMLDLERVAPAMPGAEVLEKTDDDHYKVAIKVKVGPISMQYKGDVTVVDKNPEAHSAKLKVQAREARGQGTASADVDMKLDERDGGTHGQMTANVQLAGRAAAMGRGVIQDVSAKLVDQFANNLGSMLGTQPAAASGSNGSGAEAPSSEPAEAPPASGGAQTPAGAGSAAGADAATKAGDAAPKAGAGPAAQQTWTPPDQDEGVDALGIAASVAGDRLKDPKVLGGLIGGLLVLLWLMGRRS
jgi:carbon monoxide dehydrogenase subunit G